MKNIEINVHGKANTGKSTVMEYIKRSLSKAGVESITMNCLDGIEVEELVANTFEKRLERLVESDTDVALRYDTNTSGDTSGDTPQLHSMFFPNTMFVVVHSDDLELIDAVIDLLGSSMPEFCTCPDGEHETSDTSVSIDSDIAFIINEVQLNRTASVAG